MMDPIIIVNFKCYPRGTGEEAVAVAQACKDHGAWAAVQAVDIRSVAATRVRTLAQHVDPVGFGAHTGAVLPEAIVAAGAWGTLLNHSERRLPPDAVAATVARCKEAGLVVVLCVESVEEGKLYADLGADYLAVELPELIGGDVSIVSADPEIVRRSVQELGSNVIIGAGIASREDIVRGVELGAAGFLPASAVMKKANDPAQKIAELYGKVT